MKQRAALQTEPLHSLFTELKELEYQPTNGQKLRALEMLISSIQHNEIDMSACPDDIDTVITRLRGIYDRLAEIDQQLTTSINCGLASTSIH